jgi:hypothetical protein
MLLQVLTPPARLLQGPAVLLHKPNLPHLTYPFSPIFFLLKHSGKRDLIAKNNQKTQQKKKKNMIKTGTL